MPGMPGNLLRLCEWMDKVGFESIPLFGRVFAMGFAMGVFFGGLQSRDRGCFWPIQGPCFLEVPITHLLTYSLTHLLTYSLTHSLTPNFSSMLLMPLYQRSSTTLHRLFRLTLERADGVSNDWVVQLYCPA